MTSGDIWSTFFGIVFITFGVSAWFFIHGKEKVELPLFPTLFPIILGVAALVDVWMRAQQ